MRWIAAELIPAEGIRRGPEGWVNPALGLRVPAGLPGGADLVLRYAMAGERVVLRAAGRRVPLWWHRRSRRLPASVARTTLSAALQLVVAMAPWLAAAAGSAVAGWLTGFGSLTATGLVVAMIVLSVVVHELGHVVAFRLLSSAPAWLVTTATSAALVRPRHPREWMVVLAGPLAPLALAAAAAPVVAFSPPSWWGWLAIAAGHLLSLAFPVGDGESLRAVLRRTRWCARRPAARGAPRTTAPPA